ncbi:MAG: hypothetical protein ACYDD0_08885 [Candidatus Dormibacteria bacterium]
MMQSVVADRKAARTEVLAHAETLRRIAADQGFAKIHLRYDGALIVHDDGPGYHQVNRFALAAAQIVGAYVHVITDAVPGARADSPAL